MIPIDELLANSATRPRALEALLVAHVIMWPELLASRARPRLSRAARTVLAIVQEQAAIVRVAGPAAVVLDALRLARTIPCARARGSPEPKWMHWVHAGRVHLWDVARLCQRVENLTIPDLCYLPAEIVLQLLDAHPIANLTDLPADTPLRRTA